MGNNRLLILISTIFVVVSFLLSHYASSVPGVLSAGYLIDIPANISVVTPWTAIIAILSFRVVPGAWMISVFYDVLLLVLIYLVAKLIRGIT